MIPWETLNAEQREAVEAWDCALLVMAPVGTGKTNVLALRAAHAAEMGVAPASMLCLSFTNKAAREVKGRLAKFLGKPGGEITAKTFHGLCAQILRAEANEIGWDRDFLIYDEEDCRSLMGAVAKQAGLAPGEKERDGFEFLLFQAAAEARLSEFESSRKLTPQQVFERLLGSSKVNYLKVRKGFEFKPLLLEYMNALRDCHAVDFADLIVGLNRLWQESRDCLERWRAKFEWIQVDEVQDTNRGEYRPLALLAEPHRRLSFFGDIDQTIYEWRGSAPREILADYKTRFAPVTEIQFTRNYRSSRTILAACERLITSCPGALTKEIVPQSAEAGAAIEGYQATEPRDEARWIAERARAIVEETGIAFGDVAVLTRNNFTARDLSRDFTAFGLPHLQVDQFKFFQRAEVKEAVAHVRLLLNGHDQNSLMRYLKTPPKGVGEATVKALLGEPREAGLKMADLLEPETFVDGDPFAVLLAAVEEDRVVVFDLETTGVRVEEEEIVEVAAARGGRQFHAYVRPSKPVGDSYPIHKLSDAFLAENGRKAEEVVAEFRVFCSGCVLVGHNVRNFDVPMVESVSRRLGLGEWERLPVFDTMDLARRFLRLPRYKLGEICRKLGLKSVPTHRADADVAATVELLEYLLPQVASGEVVRREAVRKFGGRFEPLALQMSEWRKWMKVERPAALLERVLGESGLLKHYAEDEVRRGHLEELLRLFAKFDDESMTPSDALLHVLSVASLGKEIDGQSLDRDKVLLLTVHQAKGLEFDTVFVAGAADGEFPNRRSVLEGLEVEEQRLFYVAISRAKRRLLVSYPVINTWGREQARSRYWRTVLGRQ